MSNSDNDELEEQIRGALSAPGSKALFRTVSGRRYDSIGCARLLLTSDLSEVRSPIDSEGQSHLLVIGMNPSTARVLGPVSMGGDPTTGALTTENMLTYLDQSFGHLQQMTLVNLVPLISSKPELVDSFRQEHEDSWRDLLSATQIILNTLASSHTHVLPMWGKPEPALAWKRDARTELDPSCLTDLPVLAWWRKCSRRGAARYYPGHINPQTFNGSSREPFDLTEWTVELDVWWDKKPKD